MWVPLGLGFFFDIHLQLVGTGSSPTMGCDFRTWGQPRIVCLGDGPSLVLLPSDLGMDVGSIGFRVLF